jgi:hypothetical protein
LTVESPAAGEVVLPPAPSLNGALRSSISDFYFNSWRLVPANLLWGLILAILYLVAIAWWPVALVLSPVLALPYVGMNRLGGLIVRGEEVSFSDGVRAWREVGVAALLVGALAVLGSGIMLANLIGGLQSGDLLGVAFATAAAWGLIIGWVWLCAWWPIVADPRRRAYGLIGTAKVAAYLVIAHPVRLAALGLLLLVLDVASTLAFAALVTVSLSFGAVVACRYVLPAADRMEARLAAGGVVFARVGVVPAFAVPLGADDGHDGATDAR